MLSDGVLRLRQIGSEVGGIAFQESRQRYVQVVADPQQCTNSWQTLSGNLVINSGLRYPYGAGKGKSVSFGNRVHASPEIGREYSP